MADAEQMEILRTGVVAWNDWRNQHPGITPDLFGADLNGNSLLKVNLSETDLRQSNLLGADLCEANLRATILSGADLRGANLNSANLGGADLSDADLSEANLSAANLIMADLMRANLRGCRLNDADLSEVDLFHTIFAVTSLEGVKGLETCNHSGRSVLDYHTLVDSGPLPEVFLRGCGLSDEFIHYLPSFLNSPIQFYSCFISYSQTDKAFARRLHDTLQGRGVRCWLDEHQLLPGDPICDAIDQGIRLWDKVLLCCSEASLNKSWWVENEIQIALKKEQQLFKERGKKVLSLIPLNLDGYLLGGSWQSGLSTQITTRLAADFTGWEKDNAKFEVQFERVVKALRADGGGRVHVPAPKL